LPLAGGPGDQHHSVGPADGVHQQSLLIGVVAESLDSDQCGRRVEQTLTIFSPNSVGSVLTRKSIARDFDRNQLQRPSCGTRFSAMSSLEMTLNPRGDLFLDDDRRCAISIRRPSSRLADPVEPLEGLEVNVRGAGGNGSSRIF